MNDSVLTAQRILEAAEEVLRRYGPAKATVVDAATRFHKPAHAAEWIKPDDAAAFDAVWSLILRGLSARTRASCLFRPTG